MRKSRVTDSTVWPTLEVGKEGQGKFHGPEQVSGGHVAMEARRYRDKLFLNERPILVDAVNAAPKMIVEVNLQRTCP